MAKLSRTLAALLGADVNLHPREDLVTAGVLAALNAELIIPVDGCNTLSVEVRGAAFSLTLNVQGSIDGTNWIQVPFRILVPGATTGYLFSVALVAAVQLVTRCGPFRFMKVVASAYTSGAATVTLLAGTGALDETLAEQCASFSVTQTAAVNTAVTATLPAVVGLRHYITGVTIQRFATALLTAGAAPVIVTSSNLPGAKSWNLSADALAAGIVDARREEYGFPLQATQTNTVTTLVFPATPLVIAKINVDYYLGQ